jgi:hypothetical protein
MTCTALVVTFTSTMELEIDRVIKIVKAELHSR